MVRPASVQVLVFSLSLIHKYVCMFWGHLVFFFPSLVCSTKKNLATVIQIEGIIEIRFPSHSCTFQAESATVLGMGIQIESEKKLLCM
jgi:hypothetical protein